MASAAEAALAEWSSSGQCRALLIEAASPKAFCSGGAIAAFVSRCPDICALGSTAAALCALSLGMRTHA